MLPGTEFSVPGYNLTEYKVFNMSTEKEKETIQAGSGEKEGDEKELSPENAVSDDDDVENSSEDSFSDKLQELEDKWLRAVAEFDNYRKRTAKEFLRKEKEGKVDVLTDLLEVFDAFDQALHHSKDASDLESFKKGFDMIFNKFIGVMKKHDVKVIEPVGEDFDPELHDAMMYTESKDYDEGKVAQVYQKGYMIDGTMVRHAKVIVSKGREGEDTEKNED